MNIMTIETIALVFTAVLSVVNFVRGRKPGVPGPQGPAGPQGVPGQPAPTVVAAPPPGAVVCSSCHRVVARFTSTASGSPVCVNCKPPAPK